MQRLLAILPPHFRFVAALYTLLVAVFSLFRYVTLLYHSGHFTEEKIGVQKAFLHGLLIDLNMALYLLLPVIFGLAVCSYWNIQSKKVHTWIQVYTIFALLLSLLICAADVPYFYFFNSRLNASAINWKNTGQVLKFVFREVQYYPFIVVILGGLWLIRRFVSQVWEKTIARPQELSVSHHFVAVSAMLSLFSLVNFGGTAKADEPLMKTAYFSNDGFLNQLALNPVHTWFDSYIEEFDIYSIGYDEAKQLVQSEFGIKQESGNSPVQRVHDFGATKPRKQNVVLILVESLNAKQIGAMGSGKNLTPGIDALIEESLLFTNFYSSGIHTNAGLFSTLYGHPIMMMQHPMYNGLSEHLTFQGLPNTLKSKGYSTHFFCTHPKTFDNLDVFLEKNGFEHLSDLEDYPENLHVNAWGVGDESLFDHALHSMDSLDAAQPDQPFFSTILTITSHPPYTLPTFTEFKGQSASPVEYCYEYADWCLSNFMEAAKTKSWYDETVFVILGDHGINMHSPTDAPLSYNHVPLLIHAPHLFPKGKKLEQVGCQTDIFPTIMGILQTPYTQNTFGYDLLREKRPYALFSQDQKLGVTDGELFYVLRKSGVETLVRTDDPTRKNILKGQEHKAQEMKNYACSMIQVSQQMIRNGQTGE